METLTKTYFDAFPGFPWPPCPPLVFLSLPVCFVFVHDRFSVFRFKMPWVSNTSDPPSALQGPWEPYKALKSFIRPSRAL
jgi:hypothetical protein